MEATFSPHPQHVPSLMSLPRFVGKVLKAGPVRAVQQQFNLDFVKTGQHVGTDALGNKYYEDLTEHYGELCGVSEVLFPFTLRSP